MKISCDWQMPINVFVFVVLAIPALAAMGDNESIVYQDECLRCHVGPANKEEANGPPLGGLSEQYILRQLEGLKYGWRGAGHPAAGIISQAISSYSDQELQDIARWASNIESEKHFDSSLGQGSTGYQLYADKCKGCHDSVIGRYMTGSPKLKNLDVDYIIRQRHYFDEGFREFEQLSKHQLKMQTVIHSLTDDEFEVLTRFIDSASWDNGENSDE